MAIPGLPAFRAQFAELAYVRDEIVIGALLAADVIMQESLWEPRDYQLAALYLAAHMAAQGSAAEASGVIVQSSEDPTTFVRSVSFGERRVMFGQRTGSRALGGSDDSKSNPLTQTSYGQMYLILRSRNIQTPMVV